MKEFVSLQLFYYECGIASFKNILETFFINVLFISTLTYGMTHEEIEEVDRMSPVKKQLLFSFQICQF